MEHGIDIDHQIKALYPETVRHRVCVRSVYDQTQDAWQVQFTKGNYAINTLLEKQDAAQLLKGRKCLSLTVEIRQMVDSLMILGLIPKKDG